ncbi:MAG: hypothetical protein ACOX0A_10520 [Thermoguttaceae bacterium]
MTLNPSETDLNPSQALDAHKPKRFRKTKNFLLFLLILICVKVGHYYCFNRPTKALNAMAVVAPDVYSRDVDYKTVYDELQTKQLLPAQENGFREILAALGPRCLEQGHAARTIPWEEFPTNEGSKSWFEETWTPLCEIFELNPNAKPTMLDRLPFMDYLVKNGITGEETSPDAGKPASETASEPIGGRTYWENQQELRGVIGTDEVERGLRPTLVRSLDGGGISSRRAMDRGERRLLRPDLASGSQAEIRMLAFCARRAHDRYVAPRRPTFARICKDVEPARELSAWGGRRFRRARRRRIDDAHRRRRLSRRERRLDSIPCCNRHRFNRHLRSP